MMRERIVDRKNKPITNGILIRRWFIYAKAAEIVIRILKVI